jgi:hypothetical protein
MVASASSLAAERVAASTLCCTVDVAGTKPWVWMRRREEDKGGGEEVTECSYFPSLLASLKSLTEQAG